MHQRNFEQLTLKIDATGRIISINTSSLRPSFAASINKESGRLIQDLCHIQDLTKLQTHLKEVMQSSTSQSAPFRMRLAPLDSFVHVKAHSRLFRNSSSGECDFIMSVMTVLSDNDVATLESHISGGSVGQNSLASMGASTSHASHHSSMGGPLMTSAINGNMSSLVQPSSRTNNVVTSFSSSPANDSSSIFSAEPFDFQFHSDSFDINGMESVGVGWDSRPDSRTSVTPVSTPRPPSVPAFSPAASICPSPLTSYHSNAGQPSPSSNNNNNNNINNNNINNNNNNNNSSSGYGGYAFPNFDEKDSKDQVHQQSQQLLQQQQQQQANHDSERLRNLLTKRPHSNTSSAQPDSEHEQRSANKILKGLLNAEEDKDPTVYNKFSPAAVPSRMAPQPKGRQAAGDMKSAGGSGNNLMLLQLLNEKSDDDDGSEARSGNRAAQSELLRQLQKDDTHTPKEHSVPQMGDEALMQLLRIQGNDYGSRKRSLNEADDGSSDKRPENKPSKLRERNKMLASLLSNPSKAPATFPVPMVKTIPDIPQSRITGSVPPSHQLAQSATVASPQQQMNLNNNQKLSAGLQQQSPSMGPVARPSIQVRKPSDVYLSQQMPTTQQDINKNQQVSGR